MGKYIQYLQGYIKQSSKNFNLDYFSVINMFDYYMFPKIECSKIDKINITIEDKDEFSIEMVESINQVFISLFTPFEEFQNLTIYKGRELLATKLLESLMLFADKYEVDKKHFINCFDVLKQKDFLFNDEIIATKKNRREIKIVFECDSSYKIYLLDIENKTKILFLDLPLGTNDLLKFYIKKIKWESPNQLLIYHSNNRDYWAYYVEKKAVEFHYPRAESGDPHGQYDLGLMYKNGSGVLQNAEQSIYWLKKAAAQGYSRAIKQLGGNVPDLAMPEQISD